MLKIEEINQPDSCFNKARPNERIFILLARDPAAPRAIRSWVDARIALGKNAPGDAHIREALQCASLMEEELEQRRPLSRSGALEIAARAAAGSSHEYTQVANFQAHEWVVNAILQAANGPTLSNDQAPVAAPSATTWSDRVHFTEVMHADRQAAIARMAANARKPSSETNRNQQLDQLESAGFDAPQQPASASLIVAGFGQMLCSILDERMEALQRDAKASIPLDTPKETADAMRREAERRQERATTIRYVAYAVAHALERVGLGHVVMGDEVKKSVSAETVAAQPSTPREPTPRECFSAMLDALSSSADELGQSACDARLTVPHQRDRQLVKAEAVAIVRNAIEMAQRKLWG
jgi:hypothetical protein